MLFHMFGTTRKFRLVHYGATITTSVIMTLLLAAPVSANEWPGFRGPNTNGVVTDSLFSQRETIGLKVAWLRALGSGYSGVSIADGYAITLFSDDKSDVAIAFDEETAKELWRFEIEPTYEGHDGSHTGPISTPLISGGRVFGLGARGHLFALDLKTGKNIWSVDLIKDFGAKKPHYGFSTSPLMVDDVLILQLGTEESAVVGLDPATGKRLWSAGKDKISYQSPLLLVRSNGQREIVAAGKTKVYGITPKTGKIVWEYEYEGKGAIGVGSMTPVAVDENRILLTIIDDESTLIELDRSSDPIKVSTSWVSRSIRKSYNVPIYHDGYFYAYTARFLTCVDASNGERMWRSRKPGDGFLVLVDGHLVIVTKDGSMHVAKASPDGYQEIAQLPVFDKVVWDHPSISNGRIYARSLGGIAGVDVTSFKIPTPIKRDKLNLPADSRFAKLLNQLEKSTDKKTVLDRFMDSVEQFPLIEQNKYVHFIYRGPAKDMAIGSDLYGLRQLKPMTHVTGTDLFYCSAVLEPDARVNYMFNKNFDEEFPDSRNPRKVKVSYAGKNMSFGRGEKMEMSWVAMSQWKAPSYLETPDASRQGRLEKKEFESKLMESKVAIDVYLPVGYDNSKDRYTVAYIIDGKGSLDGGQYQRTLDNIIGYGVAPLIAVFMPEPPPEKAKQYGPMVADELIPFMDKQFRTIASANNRAIIGTGFTGGVALKITLKHASLFKKMGIQSGAFMDDAIAVLNENTSAKGKHSTQIYIDWGKYDLRNPHEAWDAARDNRKLNKILRDHGYTVTGGEVNDGTGWTSWRNRTDIMFKTLFPAGS